MGATLSHSDELVVGKLRERGMRVTSQRVLIHRVVSARDQHLTAEQVHETVSEALPGTSLPTVYATLELFEDLGLVRRVSTGAGAVLFDSRVSPHAHTVCRRCGRLDDLDQAADASTLLDLARRAGFAPDHTQMLIWGLCSDCHGAQAER